PGGLLICSTINRNLKSFALAIVGAEYVLGWLPRGTHDWNRFVTPEELSAHLKECGLGAAETTGLVYSPLTDRWDLSSDTGVNYFAAAS
ncbi:bifunctional 2-polyprenyl-6-hydroxyphenol methylase/3-demethylubiquinol 3-O-methyltransferase UbiG, partial [Enterococcus faecium]|uniref:bifunctional 2-polyprenyl-6-hydroxyphenol methylase/3-demethylubiquinol 3-O-methyltransferase UbiG n=1 Tax=Enterococcus faecium TaxID=1352 RepID=UPI003F43115B